MTIVVAEALTVGCVRFCGDGSNPLGVHTQKTTKMKREKIEFKQNQK